MYKSRGFTLLELIITITIVGILAALALPSFQGILANTRTRATAESFSLGMQLARSEAIKRNTRVSFRFSSAGDWTVCSAVSTTVQTSCTPTTGILQQKTAVEASQNVQIVTTPASTTMITFTETGRPFLDATLAWKNPDGTDEMTRVDFSSTASGNNYRINITSGGGIKLCMPNVAADNPKACT